MRTSTHHSGQYWRRLRAMLAASCAAVLVAGLATPTQALAAPAGSSPLTAQQERSVPAASAPARPARPVDPAAAAALHGPGPAPAWPAAGSAAVDVPPAGTSGTRAARAGSLPVLVNRPAVGNIAGDSAGARAVAGAATVPGQVRVDVLDHGSAARAGVPVLMRVGRNDRNSGAGRVRVSLDYSGFRNAYGADWSTRLRLAQVPECALDTPQSPGCQQTLLASTNDVASATVSADVSLPAASTMLVAAISAPSGGAGDYTASKLSPSSTWDASGSSGDFTWSYPMRAPASLGGPSPGIGLSYDAQSVDGHTAASNNQPSWVGEGFDYNPGSISRGYKSCVDDMGGTANNTTKTGDLCWGTYNATMTLSGHSGELIRDDSTGAWHLKSDDGTRIEALTGASNGDDDGEYWRVTTTDGIQYYFGLNRLSGWTTGKPVTNSTYTVPVFSNNPGEPGYNTSFASSWHQQAWQWNLDYVVDTHGNTESFWYTQENNNYARDNNTTTVSSYVRGGHLDRIDYGSDNRSGTDTEYTGNPAMRVVFHTDDRCKPNTTCDTAHPDSWPDVPWDQSCASTTSCTDGSPTFWTQKHLSYVKTQVWDATKAGYGDVEQWTLHQSYPDPGDGTRAGLWLAGITHQGLAGSTVTMPDVTFTGVQMANRVNTTDPNGPPMKWWRISYINTEAGGIVGVTYYPAECVTGSNMPASADSNTKRCFPAYWTRPGASTPAIDWFQKYVVQEVTETDTVGGSPRVIHHYDYPNPPAWHYDSDDGLVPDSRKTWGQWRGYDQVKTTVGDPGEQSYTVTRYFRGMDGDHLSSGDARSVTVDGIADDDVFAGLTRQSIIYNGPGGAEVSASTNTPWKSGARSTRTISGVTEYARLVQPDAVVQNRVDLSGGRSPRTSTVTTTFDGTYGYPTKVADAGDDAVANTDDRCTINTYANNTSAWLIGGLIRAESYALPCGQTPASADDVISDTRTSYDGQAYGTAPTKGDVTQTESAKAWASPTSITYIVVGKAGYDAYGRLVDGWDIRGNKTHTAYTPSAGGPITKIVNTTPLGWTNTTDFNPLLGQPVDTVDVNGQSTTTSYDALGRLTAVWLPGRLTSQTANTTYAYTVGTSGSSITTSTLNATGNYVTSYQLFDGLLRARQAQSPAAVAGTGRVLTDTFYNTAGQAVKTNNPYYNTDTNPGKALFTPQDNQVPSQVVSTYDGAGRVTAQILKSDAVEQWRTSTAYGGDTTTVTPPQGGTTESSILDVRGRTVELRQYHGAQATGAYDSTSYQYNRKGQLQKLTDPAGNAWSYVYDLFSRVTSSADPDAGTSTYTYNDAGDVLTAKDSRNVTLAYAYDGIGRMTGEYNTSTTGTQLAGWTYDTVLMPDGTTPAKGQPASTTRYDSGNAYTQTVRGYTAQYQPTGVNVTIPSVTGMQGLAGTYIFTDTYNVDGSLNSERIPAAGGLAAETLTYGYDATTGLPITLKTNFGGVITPTTLVSGTAYTVFGEPSVTSYSTPGGKLAQQGLYYEEATRRLSESLTYRETAPSTVSDVHYTYDNADDITKIANTPGGGTADTQCFTNDYLQRLTEAWTPANGDCGQAPSNAAMGGPAPYWQTWTIDSAGNRTKQVDHNTAHGDATTSYSYPAAGGVQPHTLTGTSTQDSTGTHTASYTYDAVGNTLTRPGPHGQQTLTWDQDGNLATLIDSAGTNSYVYDTSGTRLVSRDPAGATLDLGAVELRLATGATTPTATRYYSFNGQTVAQRTSSGLAWLISDPHGTADTSIDATSQAVSQRRFTPYGSPRGTNPTWLNDKGFVGGVQDPTGLTREGARQYDPTIGRFISLDPVLETGDPKQLGGYAYAANNPVTSADPSGLMLPGDGGGPISGSSSGGSSGGGSGGGSWIDKAAQFTTGFKHGWYQAGANLGAHIVQMFTDPGAFWKSLHQDHQYWSNYFHSSDSGWFCAATGLCDAVKTVIDKANHGDWYGAGDTAGDYAGEQATEIAVSVLLSEVVGAIFDGFGAGPVDEPPYPGADPQPPASTDTGGGAPKPSDTGGGGDSPAPGESPAGGGDSGGGSTPDTGAGQGPETISDPASTAGGGGTTKSLGSYADSLRPIASKHGPHFAAQYDSPSGRPPYQGYNMEEGFTPKPGGELESALRAVGHHGHCAEVMCLIKAEFAEGPSGIRGGTMSVVRVRGLRSGGTAHGTTATPCPDYCMPLLNVLGIRY
jgi:RHS repeat-associated protein